MHFSDAHWLHLIERNFCWKKNNNTVCHSFNFETINSCQKHRKCVSERIESFRRFMIWNFFTLIALLTRNTDGFSQNKFYTNRSKNTHNTFTAKNYLFFRFFLLNESLFVICFIHEQLELCFVVKILADIYSKTKIIESKHKISDITHSS